MSVGACWIVWGGEEPPLLRRSIRSAQQHGLDTLVITEHEHHGLARLTRVRTFTPRYRDCRCRAAELSDQGMPFDVTVLLDTDTLVATHLTFGIEQAHRHGAAMTIAPACDAVHWHRMEGYPAGLPQYNAGVLFLDRHAQPLVNQWAELNRVELSRRFGGQDQPQLAAACYDLHHAPYTLPRTWNFRPGLETSGFGPIHVWHSSATPPSHIGELSGFWRLS